jgi:hypothetical protein
MEKSTKIIIGLGILGLGFYLYKKYAKPSTSTTNPIIDKNTGKLVEPKVVSPASPAPAKPAPIDPASGKLVIPDMPPIVVDYSNLNPNIGSSLVNTNITPSKYSDCLTLTQFFDMKSKGTLPQTYCINNNQEILTEKDLQNQFKMKDAKNELSRDQFGNLNSMMTRGIDFNNIDNPAGYVNPKGKGTNNSDPYGYGYVVSQ